MSSLQDVLAVPSAKVPIDITSFISYVIPPIACYLLFALLAVTPQTRALRVAAWPVVALLAFRAVVSVDASHGKRELHFLNGELLRSMLCIAIHALSWALTKEQLVRHSHPANSSVSTIVDALDLTTNVRGYGWNWSCGLHVAEETRPTNRISFLLHALVSVVTNALMCGSLHRTLHRFTAASSSTHGVHTIFDGTLPFLVQYPRASIITIAAACMLYSAMQLEYNVFAILGVVLFRQDPARWPPAFDRPWRATSLSDFWGRRWHQFYRYMFLFGAYPFYVVFGRPGRVIGVFLMSAVYHHLRMLTFNSRSEFWRMLVGFGMMGPGVLTQRAFYKLTGRKVDGTAGSVWTMTWLLLLCNVMLDGYVGSGMFGEPSAIDGKMPLGQVGDRFRWVATHHLASAPTLLRRSR